MKVEIDSRSGFCPGVIRVTDMAGAILGESGSLQCLGDLVHNGEELARLRARGLVTISSLDEASASCKLLVRAHGEPPAFYAEASKRGLSVVDGTCPVVLKLQKDIRDAYARVAPLGGTVVIFGKIGHAEVLGLVGQTGGEAVVIEDIPQLRSCLDKGVIKAPVELFSQTTKSPDGYRELSAVLCGSVPEVTVHQTICAQVSLRHRALEGFAAAHDVVVFVSGESSSNGKALFDLCRSCNPRTYMVPSPDGIKKEWFAGADSVGVCGATSTPKWLLEKVAAAIENLQY